MNSPAMRRSPKSYADETTSQERQLQKLVYGDQPPGRPSAAHALYPRHASSSQRVEISQAQQTASSAAARLFPHLARKR
jgi:hypothetical protein